MKSKLICFLVGEAPHDKKGEALQSPTIKSVPHYFQTTVPQQFLISQEKLVVEDHEGTVILKTYHPHILLAEASFDVDNVFSEETILFKDVILDKCRDLLKEKGVKNVEEFSEEYSVFVISGYEGDPEQFFKHKPIIAGLLKSEKLTLDLTEIDYTLSSQIKYAQNDLVIVDWDGAFIFDKEGDYASTIELLQLANLQLLRYRILDKQIDERLHRVSELIHESPASKRFLFNKTDVNQALKENMLVRSLSISEFQALDRDIKLIGDWYFARLYDLVSKKFKLEDWRKTIKDKLDAIEKIYQVASEKFTISWESRARWVELLGWYVLLIGWLVLLILDIYFYKK
jgi:hypothetical protein